MMSVLILGSLKVPIAQVTEDKKHHRSGETNAKIDIADGLCVAFAFRRVWRKEHHT